ncbi:MAG: winged helix-turn-helix domain-containing protein [Bacteroidetes bacterium]|nr:winged helix-turn-helix domain-containing protein [Bacteroidota bacterium]MCZ2132937.1 winged helix-turn-helix domain-containing protein [Bacteroidota bacterium]
MISCIAADFGITYTSSGIIDLLHRIGFA